MDLKGQGRTREMAKWRSLDEWIDNLKLRMSGRWMTMIAWAVPELYGAAAYPGSRTRCPKHGGKAFFHFYADSNETGAGICPTCGRMLDGFAVIQSQMGITYYDAIEVVEGWFVDYEKELGSGKIGLLTAPEYQLPKTLVPPLLKRRVAVVR